jgi:hypothetical protein
MPRYDEFGDTIPTDHAPLEGEPRKPLYWRINFDDQERGPSTRLIAAVLLVTICAVIVIACFPVPKG